MRGYLIKKSLYTFIILIGCWFELSANAQNIIQQPSQIQTDQGPAAAPSKESEAIYSYLESSTSVSLVFASQYSGNPASIMGHTFLKFNDQEISDNLRPAVNYGADVDPSVGALEYVLAGLSGGFKGQYGLESYFQKKKEYRDIENRDLWEYEIDLSSTELEKLKRNLALESSTNDRRYYFLDKNCSYEILRQIEIAKGDVTLTTQNYFYVLPQETIRWLDEKGLIKKRELRPALRNKMLFHYRNLSSESKIRVQLAWTKKKVDPQLTAEELNLLLLRLQIEEYRHEENPSQDLRNFGNDVLVLRSKLNGSSNLSDLNIPSVDPSTSHRPHLAKISFSNKHTEIFISPGIHHLSQDPSGYSPNTEMSFLGVTLGVENQSSKTYLNELNFITMSSWIEYSMIDPKYSWRLKIFDQREPLATWETTRTQRLELSGGYGFTLGRLKTSVLLGGLLTHGSTRRSFEGSRIQGRVIASYLADRKWLFVLEAFNTSNQIQTAFKDSVYIQGNIWALQLAKNFDLSIGVNRAMTESSKANDKGLLSAQYSF